MLLDSNATINNSFQEVKALTVAELNAHCAAGHSQEKSSGKQGLIYLILLDKSSLLGLGRRSWQLHQHSIQQNILIDKVFHQICLRITKKWELKESCQHLTQKKKKNNSSLC